MIQHVTDDTFDAEVLRHPGLVLVDFWAPWCGPCRAVAPVLEQIAGEYGGKVKVVKLNTDDNPAIATKYNIRSIPTVMLLKDGRVVETLIGSRPKGQFTAVINKQLGSGVSA
jgi:thioredoxin 1